MTIMKGHKDEASGVHAREKIWKVIRIKITFTFDEIVPLAGLSYRTVSAYLLQLYKADYILQAGKKIGDDGKKKNVWRLKRNTGPKAPEPCRCLFDPNLDDLAEVKHVA